MFRIELRLGEHGLEHPGLVIPRNLARKDQPEQIKTNQKTERLHTSDNKGIPDGRTGKPNQNATEKDGK